MPSYNGDLPTQENSKTFVFTLIKQNQFFAHISCFNIAQCMYSVYQHISLQVFQFYVIKHNIYNYYWVVTCW